MKSVIIFDLVLVTDKPSEAVSNALSEALEQPFTLDESYDSKGLGIHKGTVFGHDVRLFPSGLVEGKITYSLSCRPSDRLDDALRDDLEFVDLSETMAIYLAHLTDLPWNSSM